MCVYARDWVHGLFGVRRNFGAICVFDLKTLNSIKHIYIIATVLAWINEFGYIILVCAIAESGWNEAKKWKKRNQRYKNSHV